MVGDLAGRKRRSINAEAFWRAAAAGEDGGDQQRHVSEGRGIEVNGASGSTTRCKTRASCPLIGSRLIIVGDIVGSRLELGIKGQRVSHTWMARDSRLLVQGKGGEQARPSSDSGERGNGRGRGRRRADEGSLNAMMKSRDSRRRYGSSTVGAEGQRETEQWR